MLNFKRRGAKSRKPAKPDDGELIAYLDGQLSAERQGEIQRLLEDSWELRSRLADIETDTKFYVDVCAHEPPCGFPDKAEIWRRLQNADRVQGTSRAVLPNSSLLAQALNSPFRRYERALLYGVAAASLTLLIVSRWQIRTVSAAEVLGRAETAELTAFDRAQAPVLHQTLTARTGDGEAGTASWEIWNSVKSAKFKEYVRGSQQAVTEIKAVLKANHMDEHRPLSMASYQSWRRHARIRQEEVKRATLGDGENAFRIDATVEGSVPEEGILETSLVIRERDWHPVAQQFELKLGGELKKDELGEVGFEVVPVSQTAAIFADAIAAAPTRVPTAAAALAKPAMPPSPTPLQLWSVELRARYALHRLGACMGEPITITHTSDQVEVRGLVESEERKQQLLQQLAGVGGAWLKTDIKTVQEVSQSERSQNDALSQASTVVGSPASSDSSGILPIETLLAKAGVKYGTEEVTRFSNDAVSSARSLLMEAWALQHLAERYGAAAPEEVDPNERPLLDAMFRDHTHAMEDQNSKLSLILHKFLPPRATEGGAVKLENGAADWAAVSGEALATAKEVEQLALALFSHVDSGTQAPSGEPPDQVEKQARRLETRLAELSGYASELEATLAQGLLPVPALAQTK